MIARSALNRHRQSLQRRLFLTMFIFSILLLSIFFSGLFLILGHAGTKQQVAQKLDFQLEIFSRETISYYKELATTGVLLSQESTGILMDYLDQNKLAFSDLNDSEEHIAGVQNALFDALRHKLLEANCTGAFVMLEATVNSKSQSAGITRTGIYLQRSTLDSSDNSILLYRGLSGIAKARGYMPHRKWRLEFDTTLFPHYNALLDKAGKSLAANFRTSKVFTLPGTSERVMLMTLPLIGDQGQVYGLCGLEVSQSYFKQVFAQPSTLERASFCLSKGKQSSLSSEECLSAGLTNGYYSAPVGTFSQQAFDKQIELYQNSLAIPYIGLSKDLTLFPGNADFTLRILVPKQDYDAFALQNLLRIVLLIALFFFLAAGLCVYFSYYYLIPLKKSIEEIRQKAYTDAQSPIAEIDDLFVFLEEENRTNEALLEQVEEERIRAEQKLEQIEEEKVRAEQKLQEIQQEYDKITRKIDRLADARKGDIDPDDYENFKIGFKLLTKREREILQLYREGKGVQEIMGEADLKESTVRFHNRNIYSKLGVHSLKQLLLYLAVMERDEGKKH